ncbi:cytochrome P450 [Ornithinimicrobium pratense]|uniref:Cytochrome P450 n=1 Tax=Ornithinimicrobium pratense TaxID=2593973 RepID=A0A5J6V6H2_9MICO|nr:cytochrome P450 [Ornithinimicrobium pratense]QFG69378.1 cytochrome P450 [Ornithinimicrobium pratense]
MGQLATVSPTDLVRTLGTVMLPPVVKGPIVRRPRAVTLLERMDAERHALTQMQRLREKHGPDPVQINLAGRRLALVLDPDDVHRVLNESPEPFAPASLEKRGALGHFQPAGVLASSNEDRRQRRPFNEDVLATGTVVHPRVGLRMAQVAQEEMDVLLGHVDFAGELDWDSYARAWMRIVRRAVLGDSAREDEAVTDELLTLRRLGNLSYLAPRRPALRARFLERLRGYVDRAEPGSLAEVVAQTPAPPGTEPHQQIPQWLFAFDAATWASLRALALLTDHPGAADRVRAELDRAPDLPFTRSAVLESLRLWPTTPLILREATRETSWRTGTLPEGASLVIFAPFFHRDDQRLPQAHTFDPDQWLQERTDEDWPLVPFSGGPAMCPGRNVVLLVASSALGHLIGSRAFGSTAGLEPGRLPSLLSPFRLRFPLSAPAPA